MLTYADVIAGRLLLHEGAVTPQGMWAALREVAASGQTIGLTEALARGPLAGPGGAQALERGRRNVALVERVEVERTLARLVQQSRVVADARVRELYNRVRAGSFQETLAVLLVELGLLTARQAANLRARMEERLEEARAERVQALKNLVATLGPHFTAEEARRVEEVFASAAQGAVHDEARATRRPPVVTSSFPRQALAAASAARARADAVAAASRAEPRTAPAIEVGPLETAIEAAAARPAIDPPRRAAEPAPVEPDEPAAAPASAARPPVEAPADPLASASLPAAPAVDPESCPIYGYEIIEELGKGAMGVVYKARHVFSDRSTALKILPLRLAEKTQYLERFKREAMALMRIEHPHVVRAFDFGGSEEYYYLALEFVEGETLDAVLKREGRLPEPRALEITRQVALGLDPAAAAGIVHRDIKPENVMVTGEGVAKICDFGIVKLLDQSENGVTMAGTTVGTPFYISPEQARGEDDLDMRSDVYSLGISLFHLTTGRVPFTGRSQGAILVRHILEDVPDPRTYNPELSPALSALVARMTCKRREERYTPAEVVAAIDAARGG